MGDILGIKVGLLTAGLRPVLAGKVPWRASAGHCPQWRSQPAAWYGCRELL